VGHPHFQEEVERASAASAKAHAMREKQRGRMTEEEMGEVRWRIQDLGKEGAFQESFVSELMKIAARYVSPWVAGKNPAVASAMKKPAPKAPAPKAPAPKAPATEAPAPKAPATPTPTRTRRLGPLGYVGAGLGAGMLGAAAVRHAMSSGQTGGQMPKYGEDAFERSFLSELDKIAKDMPSFLKQDRPEKVKDIYQALTRRKGSTKEMKGRYGKDWKEVAARIASRQGKPGKQEQGPPYKAPINK
jgi:hypothetical protein